MTIYAAAWEADSVVTSIGTLLHDAVTTSRDTAYTNVQLYAQYGAREFYVPFNAALSEVWIHFTWATALDNSALTNAVFSMRNGSSLEYRLAGNGVGSSGVWNFQKTTDGTTWTTLFTIANAASTPQVGNVFDFHIKPHATTGFVHVYNAGMLVAAYDGNTSAQTNLIDRLHLDGHYNGGQNAFTEFIVADVPTIAWRLQALSPNAAGTYSEWTGSYTDVSETILNDTTFIVSNVVNNRFLANTVDPTTTTLGSREVKAVVTATRIMRSADATPADAQHLVRTNGGDYVSANLGLAADGAIRTKITVWETNPSTSVKWTLAEGAALQVGVKAV